MRNSHNACPALILIPQAENPVPPGYAGLWFDGEAINMVSASGSISILSASPPVAATVMSAPLEPEAATAPEPEPPPGPAQENPQRVVSARKEKRVRSKV